MQFLNLLHFGATAYLTYNQWFQNGSFASTPSINVAIFNDLIFILKKIFPKSLMIIIINSFTAVENIKVIGKTQNYQKICQLNW